MLFLQELRDSMWKYINDYKSNVNVKYRMHFKCDVFTETPKKKLMKTFDVFNYFHANVRKLWILTLII